MIRAHQRETEQICARFRQVAVVLWMLTSGVIVAIHRATPPAPPPPPAPEVGRILDLDLPPEDPAAADLRAVEASRRFAEAQASALGQNPTVR